MIKPLLYITCISFLIASCKSDEPDFEFPSKAIVVTKAFDVGNSSSLADVRVDFSLAQSNLLEKVKEARVYLANGTISLAQATDIVPDRYSTASLSDKTKLFFSGLSGESKDTDGDAITNGIDYNVYIYLISENGDVFLSNSTTIKLADKPIYSGSYSGVWNDALFSNFKVTMILYDDYSGVVYYSSNFTTCCPSGGSSDATVQFIIDGKTISSFKAMQFLGSYKGGNCAATYTAQGEVTDEITLSLTNLAGKDCDGDHAPGRVVFTRQ